MTQLNLCNFAVFNVSAADVFNANAQQIELRLNGNNPSGVLINVSGTDMNWEGGGNMVSAFTDSNWRKRVLWNFYEAQTLNVYSKSFSGAVMAPLAAAQSSGGVFEGSTVFNSLTTIAELHVYGYEPDPSCLVPPTADNATAFRGQAVNNGRRLQWTTPNELQLVGFNVLRSGRKDGTYITLNPNLITAKSAGSVLGAAYKFKDKTAKSHKKYFYKLEIATLTGVSVEGPIKVMPQ